MEIIGWEYKSGDEKAVPYLFAATEACEFLGIKLEKGDIVEVHRKERDE